jgi:hypothetical protein
MISLVTAITRVDRLTILARARMRGSTKKSAAAQNYPWRRALFDQWRNGIRKNASRS